MAEAALTRPGDEARGAGTSVARRLLRDRKVVVGGGFILFLAVLAIFAPLIAPTDPLAQDLSSAELPPIGFKDAASDYWLGTDDLGRDVLSRLIFGARIALTVAFVAATLAASSAPPSDCWPAGTGDGSMPRCRGWSMSGWRSRRCCYRFSWWRFWAAGCTR